MTRPQPAVIRSAPVTLDGERDSSATWSDTSGIVRGPSISLPDGLSFERLLGYGSMGVVVAARVERTGELVAVKMLGTDHAIEPEQRTRLFREASAASRLTSDHVAKVLDVGERADGAPYIIMEYLDGETLDDALRLRGPLRVELAIECVMQALDALGEAHALGLVHRDVKPSNLFLSWRPDGTPLIKVLDFGLVKDVIATRSTRLTGSGWVLGTPAYMAPEQLRAGMDVDAGADVWAIGVTLFELLTGDVPFMAPSIPLMLAHILHDAPPSLTQRRPDVSPRLERIVHRCLAKAREDRYGSAAEVALALGAELF